MKSRLLIFGLLFLTGFPIPGRAQSVLPNGDFEDADPANPTKPAHWDLVDGLGVSWVDAPPTQTEGPSHGKVIQINTNVSETDMNASWSKIGMTKFNIPKAGGPISESYGLSYYSDPVPLIPGKAYKITFDYMSEKGTAGKVWLRGYKKIGTDMRRLYESIIECDNKGSWKTYTGVFHPTKHNPTLTEFRIMLYAFYPAGVCWFDNIKVEVVDEPQPTP